MNKTTKTTPPETTTWLTCREMADHLGCCEQTMRNLARAGRVPAIKVGVAFRFDRDAVVAALAVPR